MPQYLANLSAPELLLVQELAAELDGKLRIVSRSRDYNNWISVLVEAEDVATLRYVDARIKAFARMRQALTKSVPPDAR